MPDERLYLWYRREHRGDGAGAERSPESAILITLPPGGYTAIVTGSANGTGVGLVEVFEVP